VGSNSSKATSTETNNMALDRSATVSEGTAIMDAVIVDPSDEVMIETMREHRASFAELTAASTVQLDKLLGLGTDVLKLVDTGQADLRGMAYEQLRTAVQVMETAKQNGAYAIDFAETAVVESFNLASDVTGNTDDRLAQALDLVSEVKTGDSGDLIKSLTTTIALFGVVAIYLATRKK